MNIRNHRTSSMFIGAIIIIMLACNIPSVTINPGSGVTSTVPPAVLPPTITQPASTVQIPTATLTLAPTNLSTNTIIFTPTRTLTPITPLPDFDSIVNFGGGGGDAPCLYIPDKPLPAVEGSTAFGQYFLPRTAILCIWGVPFDTPLQISMRSPSGELNLNASILIQSSPETVIWLDPNISFTSSLAAKLGNTTGIFLNLWWPGQTETGDWQVNVSWNGGSIAGVFSAKTGKKPEISVVDNRSKTNILPGRCLPTSNNNLKFFAENFPAGREVFVLVYSKAKDGHSSYLVSKQVAQADNRGSFIAELNQSVEPGTYSVVGLVDPQIKVAGPGGQINYDAIADAIDCVVIDPSSSMSNLSCPGAPRQRMIMNQRGYVCTKSDPVRLCDQPLRLSNAMMEIGPGTQFTVIGGPACADNWSWWNVRLDNGTTGWVSEGGDAVDPYFICPLK
jgi:hypothetical protein